MRLAIGGATVKKLQLQLDCLSKRADCVCFKVCLFLLLKRRGQIAFDSSMNHTVSCWSKNHKTTRNHVKWAQKTLQNKKIWFLPVRLFTISHVSMNYQVAVKDISVRFVFILVEVRLGLFTLNGGIERLQVLLCVWHRVVCLWERQAN